MKVISSLAIYVIVVASLAVIITSVHSMPKSLYLIANHHLGQFDAWNINPDGTVIYQATYWLSHATDPAGIAIDESSNTLFITSEFSSGVEMVDAITMTSIGVSLGPSDLAGIDTDDANNIVYTVLRMSNELYAFDWDPIAKTLTPKIGFDPYYLPNCSQALGIEFDAIRGILWVADAGAGVVRAYDVHTWMEDVSQSFTPVHKPVDIAVDRIRGFVYTVSMYPYVAWLPSGTGSDYISIFDLTTRTETVIYMGHDGVGISVDEVTGFVYVTGCSDAQCMWYRNLEVWDPSTRTKIQDTGPIGNPAGICIPRTEVAYNPLCLSKDDGLGDGGVNPGESITYTITYDNTKNAYDVHNVILIDNLPLETTFVSASGGGIYDPTTHTVTWNIGILAAGSGPYTETLTVTVKSDVIPGSTIINYATIDSSETPPTTVTESTFIKLSPIVLAVYVDIKPGSWPNPINIGSKGTFAVAICGTEQFDVITVDPATVKIYFEGIEEGVAPLRWSYEDVATPYTGEPGGGHALRGDGYMDLVFHFDTQAVVNTLHLYEHVGETVPLIIRGNLLEELGGTLIQGQDYVRIVAPRQYCRNLSV
ncbi:MAG: hypothetical protein QXK47_06365 [Candidatus Bathyarchaeia archaeon]